jgi:putative transposase
MPRIARIVVPGIPHHVTQRGNRQLDVFFNNADYQKFLQFVLQYSREHCLSILAYCLMTNHDHFICIPSQSNTLELVFKPLHMRYSQYINWQHSTSGRLWQGRFFSCPMDESHLWAAIRYVERNPVRAGIVSRAEDYPWSSASAHCGLRDDPLLSPVPESHRLVVANWSNWLANPEDQKILNKIRNHTRTGKPIGDQRFISDLESRLGRSVNERHKDRSKKQK